VIKSFFLVRTTVSNQLDRLSQVLRYITNDPWTSSGKIFIPTSCEKDCRATYIYLATISQVHSFRSLFYTSKTKKFQTLRSENNICEIYILQRPALLNHSLNWAHIIRKYNFMVLKFATHNHCYRVILGVKQSSSVAKPPCFDSILVRALPLGPPISTGLLP